MAKRAAAANAEYSLSSFARFAVKLVLIGPEGLYLRSYFQPHFLFYASFNLYAGTVGTVTRLALLPWFPPLAQSPGVFLAISSWAQLLEKLPTGKGHNDISTGLAKKVPL